MDRKNIINEIKREYEKDRQEAELRLSKMIAEVYKKSPEIKELDESLAQYAIKISRAILAGKEIEIEKLAQENRLEQDKREKLLKAKGFGEGFLRDIYKCSKCSDTGYIENGDKCFCFKQKLISRYYQMSSLSRVFDEDNFDNFDFKYYSASKDKNSGISPREKMKIIHSTVLKCLENFDYEPFNLFFIGQVGVGKTFMCSCIAKEVLEKGHTVLYAPATRLFKTIEDARFHREDMSEPSAQIDFFYQAELLIIDDLGTEFSTLATNSALFDIINSRILDGRSTIISSNLSLKELENNYSDRIISRFLEHYGFCHFLGEDIRQIKKYSRSG